MYRSGTDSLPDHLNLCTGNFRLIPWTVLNRPFDMEAMTHLLKTSCIFVACDSSHAQEELSKKPRVP